eukprot:6210211-Pleurochrysis_carterae.AAC.2
MDTKAKDDSLRAPRSSFSTPTQLGVELGAKDHRRLKRREINSSMPEASRCNAGVRVIRGMIHIEDRLLPAVSWAQT